VHDPTDPEAIDSGANSDAPLPAGGLVMKAESASGVAASTSGMTPGASGAFGATDERYGGGESNYEVFDPLNWLLDGNVDFPYSFTAIQGLTENGMT
jgi:hypothetical protein